MKKWALGIIVFTTAIFLIGTIKVKAMINTTFGDFPELPAIPSSQYSQQKYFIYKGSDNSINLVLVPNFANAWGDYNTTQANYYQITLSTMGSSTDYRGKLYKLNNNVWSSSRQYNSFGGIIIFATNFNIYTDSSYSTVSYPAGYNIAVPVEQLPHLVYNISVDEDGHMYLDYYYDTINTSGRELITCIRYVVPANEGVSCNRNYELNHIYRFGPIYPTNTYNIQIQDFNSSSVLYEITINIQEYIDSLPDIEKTDIIAEYTYYNQDYLTDSPKALTNLLNVLNAPIQVITDIVLYIWNSLNVYIKLFLIGMFSAVIFSAIIRYIK